MIILINNKFVKKAEAKISIFSTAFTYGYGAFETLRTYENKKVFKAKEHIDRLFKSAKQIELKIKYSKKEILEMLTKTAKKSKNKIQKIKIIVTEEGITIVSDKLKIQKNIYEKGVTCKSIEAHREMPTIKTLSFLSSYINNKKATNEGFYEAILINKTGQVYEGAYSNIFWFEKNILCTRENEILEGITREEILKISPFKIKFKTINIKELMKKEEVFLSQTTKGIVPISRINKTKIGTGKAGEKTQKLIEIFSFSIKEELKQQELQQKQRR